MAHVVEELACAGFRDMQGTYEETGPQFWLDSWEASVLESVREFQLESR